MGNVFSKLSRRFKSSPDKATQPSSQATTTIDNASKRPQGSRDYARLVESVKALEEEFHAAMRRTQDPVLLSALTQSLLIVRHQVEPLLKTAAADEDRANTSDFYDYITQNLHDVRKPVDDHEDRIRTARYKTTVNQSLHETKTVHDYDELLFALEDLSRKLPEGESAEVLAMNIDSNGSPYVDEMSIDWGDAGDGKITLVFGPTDRLPVPDANQDGSDADESLALIQPDEIGHGVEEEDLHGVDVEHVIDVVEAIRHDDVKTMARVKRDDPDVYRIASIADGYMVSWYDDEGDRPSMKEAVLKAINDDSAGVHVPSKEFMETIQKKLGGEGLR